jgi:hypothetical protein
MRKKKRKDYRQKEEYQYVAPVYYIDEIHYKIGTRLYIENAD